MRIFNQVVLDEFLVDTIGGTVHFTDARWSALLGTADSLVLTVVADNVVLGGGSSGSIRVFAYHSGDARFFPAGAVPASALPPQLIGKTRSPEVSLGGVDATRTWVAVGTASQRVPSGAYLTLGVKVTAPVSGTISTHVRVIVTGRIRGWVEKGRSGAKPEALPSWLASSCEESVVSRRLGQTPLARRGLPPAEGAVSGDGATIAGRQSTLPVRPPTRPRHGDADGENGSTPESSPPPGTGDERLAWGRAGLHSPASRTPATPASPPSEDIHPHPFRVTTEPLISHQDPGTEPQAVASIVPNAEPIHDGIGNWWRRGLPSRGPVPGDEAGWWRLGLHDTQIGPVLGVGPVDFLPPLGPPHVPHAPAGPPSEPHVSVKLATDVKGPDGKTWILAGHGAQGSDNANIYGTDLGFPVRLPGAKPGGPDTLIFFGDTWLNADPALDRPSPAPPAGNDDALGQAARPSPTNETPAVDFFSSAETKSFEAISVGAIDLGSLHTPIAAFTTADGETYVAVNGDPAGTRLARWNKNGPTFSVVETAKPFARSLAVQLPDKSVQRDVFALVAIFAVPASKINAGGPFDKFKGDAIFVWGRGGIQATRYKAKPIAGLLDAYLFAFDSAELALQGPPVTYWYFCGFDGNQAPIWKDDATDDDLKPVIQTDDTSEAWVINQMTATYDHDLGLWLLLYGGHVTPPFEGTVGDFSSPPPVETKLGVHLRSGLSPWGPWSPPLRVWPDVASGTLANFESRCGLVFLPEAFVVRYGALPLPQEKYGFPFSSSPGEPVYLSATLGHAPGFPDCVLPDDLTAAGGGRFAHGAEYGAAIWQGAGNVVASDPSRIVKTMYFTMSTYNPYHVILMRTEIARMLQAQ